MTITIHRGTHQIGACVTEYAHEGWHLFVDYGEELPGTPKTGPIDIPYLTKGDLSKSALLITHYHGDHIGYITELPKELPIYMGKVGCEIQRRVSEHLSYVDDKKQKMIEMMDRLKATNIFEAGKPFNIGFFSIMPINVDHSAFDAYAFKISVGKQSVFHTGDFRTHGFRSCGGKFENMIKKYIVAADCVVCEATNVTKEEEFITEQELQQEFIDNFTANKGNIVYVTSTNIDRLFSLYHAALKSNRPFYVDKYQKGIMDVVAQEASQWRKSEFFQYDKTYQPKKLQTTSTNSFRVVKKFKDALNQHGYVLIARAGEKFDNLIQQIPGEKTKYLSMWEGYVTEGSESYNENLVYSLGDNYKLMHTSGHCSMEGLEVLLNLLQPKSVVPIHTDNPEAFEERFKDKWNVIMLTDGDSIEC